MSQQHQAFSEVHGVRTHKIMNLIRIGNASVNVGIRWLVLEASDQLDAPAIPEPAR
jgi:hypothetical protein